MRLPDLLGRWADRHPLNVPGTYYGALTDTCCDGPPLAPASLMVDEDGSGFVWRQPRDGAELRALLAGCRSDPMSGFAADGDAHWTPDLVRAWWHDLPVQAPRIERIRQSWAGDQVIGRVAREWTAYLTSPDLEADLRRYVFLLSEGRAPAPAEPLPPLDRR